MAKRRERPPPRWQSRLAIAVTPEQRLAVTYDRLRASLRRLARRHPVQAQQVIAEAERSLAALAATAESVKDGDPQ